MISIFGNKFVLICSYQLSSTARFFGIGKWLMIMVSKFRPTNLICMIFVHAYMLGFLARNRMTNILKGQISYVLINMQFSIRINSIG